MLEVMSLTVKHKHETVMVKSETRIKRKWDKNSRRKMQMIKTETNIQIKIQAKADARILKTKLAVSTSNNCCSNTKIKVRVILRFLGFRALSHYLDC